MKPWGGPFGLPRIRFWVAVGLLNLVEVEEPVCTRRIRVG